MANCAAIAAAASAVPTIASDNGSGELTARASLLFLPLSIPPSLLPFLWRPSSVSSESWAMRHRCSAARATGPSTASSGPAIAAAAAVVLTVEGTITLEARPILLAAQREERPVAAPLRFAARQTQPSARGPDTAARACSGLGVWAASRAAPCPLFTV